MASPNSAALAAVDGIRGFACLMVLVVHSLAHFELVPGPALAGGGKLGVWLFFVLSAFLLSLRLQQRGFGFASLSDYILGRCLRIVPPFIVACLVYYWAEVGIASSNELDDALLMQQGFIHLWTIPVEFKFYFLLPPLVFGCLFVQRHSGDRAMIATAIIAILVQQYFWPYWNTPENSPDSRWYLATFLLGIPCALLLPKTHRLVRPRVATAYACLAFAVLLLSLPGTRHWLTGAPMAADLADKHLFLGLLWAGFIVLLASGEGIVGRLMRSRALSYLGQISYSTYLFHYLFIVLLAAQWPQSIAAALLALALSLLAGGVGYYLLERPFEGLRRVISPYQRRERRVHKQADAGSGRS